MTDIEEKPLFPHSVDHYRAVMNSDLSSVFWGYIGIVASVFAVAITTATVSFWFLPVLVPIYFWSTSVYAKDQKDKARKDEAVKDMLEWISISGIGDYPDKDTVIGEMQDLVFAGKASEIILLNEVEVERWRKIYALLDFVRMVYGTDTHYQPPGGYRQNEVEAPIRAALKTRFVKKEGYMDSPELMEIVWQNSNTEEREYWIALAKINIDHMIHYVFPKRQFSNFIASKVPEVAATV